jgi:hypothetical protein
LFFLNSFRFLIGSSEKASDFANPNRKSRFPVFVRIRLSDTIAGHGWGSLPPSRSGDTSALSRRRTRFRLSLFFPVGRFAKAVSDKKKKQSFRVVQARLPSNASLTSEATHSRGVTDN